MWRCFSLHEVFRVLCTDRRLLTTQEHCRHAVVRCYPRRARSALGVDTVLTLDVCLYVCMLVL